MSKEKQDGLEYIKSCTKKPVKNSGSYLGPILVLM